PPAHRPAARGTRRHPRRLRAAAPGSPVYLGVRPAWLRRGIAGRGQLLLRRGQRRPAPGRRLGGRLCRADQLQRRLPAPAPARPEDQAVGVRRLAPRPYLRTTATGYGWPSPVALGAGIAGG